MFEPGRRDRHDTDPAIVDQEGIFVGAVRGAAVLHDTDAPRRDLIEHAIVQKDHAVRDIFLDAIAGQLAFAALARDDRSDPLVLEPCEEASKLAAQHRLIRETREQRLYGVKDDALGADLVN